MKNVSFSERILYIDVLRGCALLFILLAHSQSFFSCLAEPKAPLFRIPFGDAICEHVVYLYMVDIGFLLFAFLFGVSFSIQMRRAEEAGKDFRGRMAWRLALLFAVGLVHYGLYVSEVLSMLAVCGFGLIMMWRWKWKLLSLSALCCVLMPLVLHKSWFENISIMEYLTSHFGIDIDNFETMRRNHLQVDGFWSQVIFHYEHLDYRWFIHGGMRIWFLMTAAILGLMCGKMDLLRGQRRISRSLLLIACGVLSVPILTLFDCGGLWRNYGAMSLSWRMYVLYWGIHFSVMLAIVIGLYYIYFQTRCRDFLNVMFSGAGRMAFTCYIMQSLLMVPFFAPWGFAVAGLLSPLIAFVAGFVLFILQAWFCHVWLERFRYGPLEYLWRSATYLAWQPFLRK